MTPRNIEKNRRAKNNQMSMPEKFVDEKLGKNRKPKTPRTVVNSRKIGRAEKSRKRENQNSERKGKTKFETKVKNQKKKVLTKVEKGKGQCQL